MRKVKGWMSSGSASSVFAAVCALTMVLLWTGPALAETWSIQTIDSAGVVGVGISLALDEAGNPHVSYIVDVWTPKYAAWHGTSWSFDQPNPYPFGLGADQTSLALDSAGNPRLSYNRANGYEYASYDGSSWSHTDFDERCDSMPGSTASLVLDSADNPRISYYDGDLVSPTPRDLKYAAWTGSSWSIQTVDSAGSVGYYNSLAVDSVDNPCISYSSSGGLRYAAWNGSAWDIQTIGGGSEPSLALDSADTPHIGYYDATSGDLKYAFWTGSAWDIQTVDSAGDVGQAPSLALDADGNPHISYYEEINSYLEGNLKYAAWDGSSWTIQTVDTGAVGADSSLALDSDGNAYIAYGHMTTPGRSIKLAIGQNVIVPEPATLSLLTLGLGLLIRRRRD